MTNFFPPSTDGGVPTGVDELKSLDGLFGVDKDCEVEPPTPSPSPPRILRKEFVEENSETCDLVALTVRREVATMNRRDDVIVIVDSRRCIVELPSKCGHKEVVG